MEKLHKTKFLVTVYSYGEVPELTNEQGIALSEIIESFYKMVERSVIDAAIDDIPTSN